MVVLVTVTSFMALIAISCIVNRDELDEALRILKGEGVPALALAGALPPSDFYIDEGHAWSALEPTGTLRLGVGPIVLALLGTPDSVTLPSRGEALSRGGVTLRRGRRELSLSPTVEGEVVEVNEAVVEDPSLLGRDPYGSGWLLRVTPRSTSASLRGMRVADEARGWLRDEMSRLREAVTALRSPDPATAATMADGGLPRDGLSEHLDDAAWSELVHSVLGPRAE